MNERMSWGRVSESDQMYALRHDMADEIADYYWDEYADTMEARTQSSRSRGIVNVGDLIA